MNEVIEMIQSELLKLPLSKQVRSGNEIAAIRCPYCGDSLKSNHPHMYIGTKTDSITGNSYLVMDCKKCFTQGLVTPEVLHKLGIYNTDYDGYIKTVMLTAKKNTALVSYGDEPVTPLKYPKLTKQDTDKLNYLIDRTQIDFSKQAELDRYKIIVNLEKFLELNESTPDIDKDRLKLLNDQAIGFVSYDNTSISLRDINATTKARFTIMHLYPERRTPYMYISPCNVDLLTTTPTFVVSESAFNVICVQKYFYPSDSINALFAATGTRKAYKRTIMKLLQQTCFFGAEIVAYIDNDKDFSIDDYRDEFSMFTPLSTVKLVVNQSDNDFGRMPGENEHFDFKTYRL
jgi:hypothetical protein